MGPDVVYAICRIAKEYKSPASNRSMLALLQESGYSRENPPSEAEIAACLRLHTDLVESWLLDSVDKRASSGWYFKALSTGSDEWIVAHYPADHQHIFKDRFAACAFYIARFFEEVGPHIP